MKISIEIDGKIIEAVEAQPATPMHLTAEPPPELLAAARRLGAQSAGIAAYSMPAGATVAIISPEAVVAEFALPDADAGPGPGATAARGAAVASAKRTTGSRRVKR